MRVARRLVSWLDDQVWWHRVQLHRVQGPILQMAPEFACWAHVCETCDYTWVR